MSYFPKKRSSDFLPTPEGLHFAVCCDVVDLGVVKTSWQGQESLKDMVRLVWQTEELIPSGPKAGKPYIISKRYTSSAHPKSTLRIHIQSWAGKTFTDEAFAAFDIEKLIGHCCQIQIAHNIKNGETYSNIMAIVPPPKGKPPLRVHDYVRQKDRPGYVPPNDVREPEPPAHEDSPFPDDVPHTVSTLADVEDDIPF